MAINLSRYIDITSGIGAGANIGTRNLGALIITGNSLVPTGQFLSFTSAADVGTYFGTSSEAYKRAVFYFGWVSKSIQSPKQLSFWFWNNDTATASLIFGAPATYALSTFTAISSGQLTLTLGGFTHTLTGINLSAAGSLATVASDIQTAVRAFSGGGAAWTGATVSYDATRGCFDLVSGATGADTVAVTAAPSNDLGAPLGWLTGAILSNGTAAQLLGDNLNQLITITNNFGSFLFTTALALNLANVEVAAAWNNSLNPNIQFLYTIPVSVANASSWSAALASTGGCTLTLAPLSTEYPEMAPAMMIAATDYTQPGAVQNFMFQQFNLTPSVTSDADANTYDALLVNYYGQTQTAGQLISFYQRGVMFGTSTQPSDQNVYANELWFKDAAGAALMTLLLALNQLPASAQGRSQVLAILQTIINLALVNGTISPGKTLSTTQQLYITNATGDPNAWKQVQNIGYWVDAVVQSYVSNGITQYKIVYTLIYSKDDIVRLVTGTDILI